MATILYRVEQQTWSLFGGDITAAKVENGVCVRSLVSTRGQGVLVRTPDQWAGRPVADLKAAGFVHVGRETVYYDAAGNDYYLTVDGTLEGAPDGPVYRPEDVDVHERAPDTSHT